MSFLTWTKQRPIIADLHDRNGGNVMWWFARGGNFNRPIMVEVNGGGSIERGPELNYTFVADNYPEYIWDHELNNWFPLGLEWAGPIPLPEEKRND
jgi:hypothetical protein